MKTKKNVKWLVVGVTGIIAFILALIGYSSYFYDNQIDRNTLDIIFYSIKIFGFDIIDNYASPLPFSLEVARWLAPGVLIYFVVNGLIYLFWRQLKIFGVRFYKNHIVISGINKNSVYLIDNLIQKKEKVVVVSKSISESEKAAIEEIDGTVFIGNIDNREVLEKISAEKAKCFVFLEEDDEKNISSALSVSKILSSTQTTQYLYTHISDFLIMKELNSMNYFENPENRSLADINNGLRIFSVNERTARVIFNKSAPDIFRPMTQKSDNVIHAALFGNDELAKCLVIHFARMCHYPNFKNIDLTIFCENDKFLVQLQNHFPQLNKLINLKTVVIEPEIPDNRQIAELYNNSPFDVIYLACENDRHTVRILHSLTKIIFGKKVNTVVTIKNPDGILGKWYPPVNLGDLIIHKYNVTSENYTADSIIAGKIDKLAQIIHNDYYSKIKADGHLNPAKESHREWDYLPEEYKNKNRLQADHIWVKLRSINAKAVFSLKETEEYNFENDSEIVETLSKMEHNRWATQMILNGWKYGTVRDDKKKNHPDLIPYADLPEEVKQKSRDIILNIRNLLKQMELKIIKN